MFASSQLRDTFTACELLTAQPNHDSNSHAQ